MDVLIPQQAGELLSGCQLAHDLMRLKGVPQQMPGTKLCAVRALDTGGTGPVEHMPDICRTIGKGLAAGRQNQDTGGRLCDRHILRNRLAHHRAAGNNTVIPYFRAARKGDALSHAGADGSLDNNGLSHFTRDGKVFVDKGPAQQRVINFVYGSHIEKQYTRTACTAGGGDDNASDLVYDNLLVPGGIKAIQLEKLNRGVKLLNRRLKGTNLILIMLLEGDKAVGNIHLMLDRRGGLDNLTGLIEHEVSVGSQQRLAFRAVDDKVFKGAFQLPLCGIACSTAADNTGRTNCFH